MALLRSIATVGGYTGISRMLGFVRDILIAATVGAGPIADAFFVAFKFPNFFRRLFGEGAFNAAFVPIYSGKLAGEGREAALAFAGHALGALLTVLVLFTAAAELAMPWLMLGLAPGFADEPGKFALAVAFTRVTFPYLMLMALVALLSGILNSAGRFWVAAAAPIWLNIVLIAALVGPARWFGAPGHALAWGVAIAGIVQFLWLAQAAARAGCLPLLPWPRFGAEIRQLLRLLLPAILGAGVMQANLVLDVIFASFLREGSVSFLYYADRINQLPVGVVGAAIGVALLPLLARQLRAGEHTAAAYSQNRAIEFGLVLSVPAAAALIAVPEPIVRTLFERGAFGPESAAATAQALAAFAAGLPAYVLVKALTPAFFARHDTATPVKIAIGAMLANAVLALALMQVLAHAGIALATALSAWANAAALALVARRRGWLALDARLRSRLPRIVVGAALMVVALLVALEPLSDQFAARGATRIAALAALVALGAAVYAAAALGLGFARPGDLKTLARRSP